MQKWYWIIFILVALGAFFVVQNTVTEYSLSFTEPIGEPIPHSEKPATILFLGDMMFDRSIRLLAEANGIDFLFQNIESVLKQAQFVVANLEGVFSNNTPVARPGKLPLHFTFNPTYASDLKRLSVAMVSQANNHALDFGADGLAQSKKILAEAGIGSFGDPTNENPTPVFFTIGTEKIALIGYHEFVYKNEDKVIVAIQQAKSNGYFTVVFPHWGVEYQKTPSTLQKKMAHAFIDAGADAVIGAHPHVIEPIEIYKNKAIFYSLGNFIFDQWFSDDVMRGLGVRMSLSQDAISYDLLPIFVNHGVPELADEKVRKEMFSFFAKNSSAPADVLVGLQNGKVTLSRYGTTTTRR